MKLLLSAFFFLSLVAATFAEDDFPRFRERVLMENEAAPPVPAGAGDVAANTKNTVQQAAAEAGSNVDPNVDDKDRELMDALQAVKDQIVAKANQIKAEKRWVKEVTSIIEAYVKKTRRVNGNIRLLQKDVKEYFRKKKQIENMLLQRKLEKKLDEANRDLGTLQSAIRNVKTKEDAFNKSKQDIRSTIGALETELAKLRGVHGGGEDTPSNENSENSAAKEETKGKSEGSSAEKSSESSEKF